MARINGYPESVQAGLPKLGKTPEGWEIAPLGKYLKEVRRPVKLEDATQYRLVTVKRSRGGVVEREHLAGKDIKVKSQFRLSSGDFLISKRQIVHGACGIVPDELDGTIASNEYAVLHSSKAFFLPFLAYLAESVYFQQTCFHSSIGVHIEKMLFKLDRWLNWKFNLPPLDEQKRIVKILSTWDRAIAVTGQLVRCSELQTHALAQQLMSGKGSGLHQDDWKPYCFRNIANISKKRYDPKNDEQPKRCIELEHLESGTGRLLGYCNAQDQESLKAVFEPQDVLFGKLRPYLKKSFLADFSGVCSTEIWVFKANATVCEPSYLAWLARSDAFQRAVNVSAGSKMPRAEWQVLMDAAFRLPPKSTQKAIARTLEDADRLTNYYRITQEALVEEKAALMQQLLTGNRRVKVKDCPHTGCGEWMMR